VRSSERPARRAMRYPVEARVFFRWRDIEGNEHHGEGTSRDISETGAFVLTPLSPPLGTDIELRISFAALLEETRAVRMELGGRVLRVEQAAAGRGIGGFAVLTKEVMFRESDKDAGGGNPGANEAT
jgi:hypothetical protein